MHRLVYALVATLTITALSGCCCMDRYYYGDCGRPSLFGGRYGDGGGCASGDCGGGCEDGSCGGPSCDDCGSCNPCCFRPFRALFGRINCTSGCGDFYFDEWINDPPAPCDPCDNCGNFVGPRCCPPRWWLGSRILGGYRSAGCCDTSCGMDCGCEGGCDGGCGAGGCTSCGGGGAEYADYGGDYEEHVMPSQPHSHPHGGTRMEPTPAVSKRPAPKQARRVAPPTAPKTNMANFKTARATYEQTTARPEKSVIVPPKVKNEPTPAKRKTAPEPEEEEEAVGSGVQPASSVSQAPRGKFF